MGSGSFSGGGLTSAAAQVADVVAQAGVRFAFAVPGESLLALLDEMTARPGLEVVTARHESGAGFMADGYAKATGRPGVCMASRAPGALNTAIALHQAMQDGVPLVALVGQVRTDRRHRGAFQEIDVAAALGPVVKRADEVHRPERAAEMVARAFSVAATPRPGPAVVALPEDVLEAPVQGEPAIPPLCIPRPPVPEPGLVAKTRAWLQEARRPVAVAGQGVVACGAVPALVSLAEAAGLPVFTAWRRMDAFPNHHPHYAGTIGIANDPAAVEDLMQADLVLALGAWWDEVTSLGYRAPRGRLVHVEADARGLAEAPGGLSAREILPVVADVGLFLQALLGEAGAQATPAEVRAQRQRRVAACRERYEAYSTPRPDPRPGYVDPVATVALLAETLPPRTAIVSDAGGFATWYHRYYRFRLPGTHFAPVSGTMGYALPAAIGVALGDRATGHGDAPARPVVAMAGDGGFLMTACELATAVRLRLPIVVLVFANGLYGSIRAHHRRRTRDPARLRPEELLNPDFAALARTFGARGEAVDRDDQFPAALARALQAPGPSVIELRVDPERLHA